MSREIDDGQTVSMGAKDIFDMWAGSSCLSRFIFLSAFIIFSQERQLKMSLGREIVDPVRMLGLTWRNVRKGQVFKKG